MATLQFIRRKIGSVRSTQTITRTMWMIAAARLRKAQDAALSNRAYSHKIAALMGEIIMRVPPESHPLLLPRKAENVLIVLITSNRGLCGGFNINLCTTVDRLLTEHSGHYKNISLYTVGRKGRDYFKRRGREIVQERVDIRTLGPDLAREISEDLIDYYTTMRCDKVFLVYSRFYTVLRQEVQREELFPLKPAADTPRKIEYLFEPERVQLLAQLIPAYLEAQIYKGLLESQVSEHAARMNSMDSATNNCKKMIDELTLVYNKSRQASITKDMIDIVGGAEAIKA